MSCAPGSLGGKPGHPNWVEEQGGLPRYIERIACHLHFDKGKEVGTSIAIAVNVVKRMCSTGDVNFPGPQQVNPGSRAEACKALARWEEMKASSHAKSAAKSSS